jgi:putative peptidoglycan binding protein/YmgG-like glycine-zipper protein
MRMPQWIGTGSVVAIMALAAGCSTWDSMTHREKDTTIGAGGGAVAGAAVGGPVGAVVGAGVGGVAGHEVAKSEEASGRRTQTAAAPRTVYDSSYVRSVQQALTDRGYSPGPADGQWGPSTEDALRRFQSSQGLQATGQLDSRTTSALGL